MTRASEDDLIARFFAPMAGPGGLGLRDDAGLVRVAPGHDLVVTKDALVAGVHFFADDPPGSIARKALRVNLSDLAAKRSRPVGFLLALALPASWTDDWLAAFADGLRDDALHYACPLIGGDTVATPGPLTLSVTALGEVPSGAMLPRTTAQVGDLIYVSGTIGDAALGLRLRLADAGSEPAAPWAAGLAADDRAHLLNRYLHPQPRLALRAALRHARAGMDVSDGLVGDLAKLLRVSGVSGRVELDRVPLSAAASAALRADAASLRTIVTGGDDYEILATVPAPSAEAFEAEAHAAGVAVTRIGEVLAGGAALDLRDAAGRIVTFETGAFSHY
jgi:thiamine-monophosphate kinase